MPVRPCTAIEMKTTDIAIMAELLHVSYRYLYTLYLGFDSI
jgi:hypothetical protein